MHAACVICEENAVIIAAKSGNGKSYIADCICNINYNCSVIGDDHVIISNNFIQGNVKRRMRNIYGERVAYLSNIGISKFKNIVFTCFELSDCECEISDISGNEVINYFSNATAFKYLNEVFVYNGKSYGPNIFNNLEKEYQRKFFDFVGKEKVIYIRGSFSNAVEFISKLIKEL